MASTRNKNTPGDYLFEQRINNNISNYSTYEHAAQGKPVQSHLPGNGLLIGRMAREHLSTNYCDIENELFGIGSTNLVNPQPKCVPEIKQLQSLNVIDKLPVFLPEPLILEPNQRPLR